MTTLFIGNLPEGTTEKELEEFFRGFGDVKKAVICNYMNQGRIKYGHNTSDSEHQSVGIVTFRSAAVAQNVKHLAALRLIRFKNSFVHIYSAEIRTTVDVISDVTNLSHPEYSSDSTDLAPSPNREQLCHSGKIQVPQHEAKYMKTPMCIPENFQLSSVQVVQNITELNQQRRNKHAGLLALPHHGTTVPRIPLNPTWTLKMGPGSPVLFQTQHSLPGIPAYNCKTFHQGNPVYHPGPQCLLYYSRQPLQYQPVHYQLQQVAPQLYPAPLQISPVLPIRVTNMALNMTKRCIAHSRRRAWLGFRDARYKPVSHKPRKLAHSQLDNINYQTLNRLTSIADRSVNSVKSTKPEKLSKLTVEAVPSLLHKLCKPSPLISSDSKFSNTEDNSDVNNADSSQMSNKIPVTGNKNTTRKNINRKYFCTRLSKLNFTPSTSESQVSVNKFHCTLEDAAVTISDMSVKMEDRLSPGNNLNNDEESFNQNSTNSQENRHNYEAVKGVDNQKDSKNLDQNESEMQLPKMRSEYAETITCPFTVQKNVKVGKVEIELNCDLQQLPQHVDQFNSGKCHTASAQKHQEDKVGLLHLEREIQREKKDTRLKGNF